MRPADLCLASLPVGLFPFLPAFLLVIAGGCGSRTGGESLQAQYERAMQAGDPETRILQLLAVADKQHRAGDAHGTGRSLTSAADAARRIADAAGRAAALNRIGVAQARMNRSGEAKQTFGDVQRMLGEVPSEETRVSLMTRMGDAYGRYLSDPGEAADLLSRAETTAERIERPEGRIEALLDVASAHFRLQQADSSHQLLDRLLQDARELEDLRRRADSLASVAAALHRTERRDAAEATFEEARQTAARIADPLSQAYAYLHLGTKLTEAGRQGQAQQVLQTAENSADQVPDPGMRRPLLDRIHTARRGR